MVRLTLRTYYPTPVVLRGKNLFNYILKKSLLTLSCNLRATIDQDQDGDISKEEFISNAMKSSFIAEVLKERKRRQ